MLKNYAILSLVILLFACEDAGIVPKDYPYLLTKEPSNLTENSISFNAEVISLGDAEVTEYGFIWSTDDPTLTRGNKIAITTPIGVEEYTAEADFGLIKDQEQFVRAYLITEDQKVLGNVVSFISNGTKAPLITSFEPKSGYLGDKVKIKGENFLSPNASLKIYLGDIEVQIDSIGAQEIVFLVPDVDEETIERITIDFNGKLITSNEEFIAHTYWKKIASLPGGARHGAVSFTIGDKAFVGTGKGESNFYSDLWEYVPSNDTWTKKADFPGAPRAFGVGFSYEGKGYIGFGSGVNSESFHDLWEYDPLLNEWTQRAGNEMIRTFNDTYFIVDGLLYIHAGIGFYSLDLNTETYTLIDRFASRPYHFLSVGLNYNSLGYSVAGQRTGTGLSNDLWEYNPANNVWTEKTAFPGSGRDGVSAFILNDKIYAGLGGIFGGSNAAFFEYDINRDAWISIQNFKGDVREMPVSFVIGNKAYVGTGRKTRFEHLDDFWEFDPNKN